VSDRPALTLHNLPNDLADQIVRLRGDAEQRRTEAVEVERAATYLDAAYRVQIAIEDCQSRDEFDTATALVGLSGQFIGLAADAIARAC